MLISILTTNNTRGRDHPGTQVFFLTHKKIRDFKNRFVPIMG